MKASARSARFFSVASDCYGLALAMSSNAQLGNTYLLFSLLNRPRFTVRLFKEVFSRFELQVHLWQSQKEETHDIEKYYLAW